MGWSQVDLAANSGVSERSIAGYESSGNQPTGSILQKLATALGVSPAWLMGGEHEPMMLQDSLTGAETDLWKQRAKNAEQKLFDLQTGLRELLAQSQVSSAPAHKTSSGRAAAGHLPPVAKNLIGLEELEKTKLRRE